jgi:hypothetical protein
MNVRLPAAAILVSMIAGASAQSPQPYAGMQDRQLKALSTQQIADLRAGRGMGLALAAELNGYPGPSHLLELADQLDLTASQHGAIKGMFEAMRAETIPVGERLVAQEMALDRKFADRSVTPEALAAATAEIGATQATLRNAHLKYHLMTADILRPAQISRYAELRGYAQGGGAHQHMMHHPN